MLINNEESLCSSQNANVWVELLYSKIDKLFRFKIKDYSQDTMKLYYSPQYKWNSKMGKECVLILHNNNQIMWLNKSVFAPDKRMRFYNYSGGDKKLTQHQTNLSNSNPFIKVFKEIFADAYNKINFQNFDIDRISDEFEYEQSLFYLDRGLYNANNNPFILVKVRSTDIYPGTQERRAYLANIPQPLLNFLVTGHDKPAKIDLLSENVLISRYKANEITLNYNTLDETQSKKRLDKEQVLVDWYYNNAESEYFRKFKLIDPITNWLWDVTFDDELEESGSLYFAFTTLENVIEAGSQLYESNDFRTSLSLDGDYIFDCDDCSKRIYGFDKSNGRWILYRLQEELGAAKIVVGQLNDVQGVEFFNVKDDRVDFYTANKKITKSFDSILKSKNLNK